MASTEEKVSFENDAFHPDRSLIDQSSRSNFGQAQAISNNCKPIQLKGKSGVPVIHVCLVVSAVAIITALTTGIVTFFVALSTFTLENSDYGGCGWSVWTSWTDCNTSCGGGSRYRFKVFGGGSNCSYDEIVESVRCDSVACNVFPPPVDMRLNASTLHKLLYISDDGRTLSNTYTPETAITPDGALKTYKGAMADFCLHKWERIYFEVRYSLIVVGREEFEWLAFEIGLAERDRVDNAYYAALNNVSGWSFNVFRSTEYNATVLQAKHNDYAYRYAVLGNQGNYSTGTQLSGKFELFVDRKRDEFSLAMDSRTFYTFNGVRSNYLLCPVFGGYNPNVVHVQLTLGYSANFTNFAF